MELMIEDLMEQLVSEGGSDLHIATGQPPYTGGLVVNCDRSEMKILVRRAATN